MVEVKINDRALRDIAGLPLIIQGRIEDIVERLAEWPNVGGKKALRGDWKGYYRVRTGDYRVIFRVEGKTLFIVKVDHRKNVYED
ncbi:MAG TPA: type II toxin-antitoxin system RelE/ParE family toxin [Phycisphaerae bacterium]|nr:type II toxin-antitoxin system RelE/ParE family toxin [Phycisphaerae bacterium]